MRLHMILTEEWQAEIAALTAEHEDRCDSASRCIAALAARIKELEGYLNKPPGERLVCDDCFYPSKVKELEESLTYWKQQWGYMEAAQKQGEVEITRLEYDIDKAQNLSAIDHKTIHTQQQRIKELENDIRELMEYAAQKEVRDVRT